MVGKISERVYQHNRKSYIGAQLEKHFSGNGFPTRRNVFFARQSGKVMSMTTRL